MLTPGPSGHSSSVMPKPGSCMGWPVWGFAVFCTPGAWSGGPVRVFTLPKAPWSQCPRCGFRTLRSALGAWRGVCQGRRGGPVHPCPLSSSPLLISLPPPLWCRLIASCHLVNDHSSFLPSLPRSLPPFSAHSAPPSCLPYHPSFMNQ